MKTQTQTFEQLVDGAKRGNLPWNETCEIIKTRLINTFVHGDGVRVLRDFMCDFEAKCGDWENPDFTKSYNEMLSLLNQLDGEPTK